MHDSTGIDDKRELSSFTMPLARSTRTRATQATHVGMARS
jgi:hypothetical protein